MLATRLDRRRRSRAMSHNTIHWLWNISLMCSVKKSTRSTFHHFSVNSVVPRGTPRAIAGVLCIFRYLPHPQNSTGAACIVCYIVALSWATLVVAVWHRSPVVDSVGVYVWSPESAFGILASNTAVSIRTLINTEKNNHERNFRALLLLLTVVAGNFPIISRCTFIVVCVFSSHCLHRVFIAGVVRASAR